MTTIISINEARKHLSCLIDRAAAGEDIVIARRNRPVARLTSLLAAGDQSPRKPGMFAGLEIPDSFFAPLLEEELSAWNQT